MKTSAWAWWWPDDDVAGQVHDAGHHREARERSDDGRRHARPAQDLSERRGRSHRAPCPAARSARLELERDRPRVGADVEGEEKPDQCHRRGDEPRHDERVELEVLASEERPEDQGAQRGTEERAEEDVRDRARLLLGRVHVGRGGAREEHAAVHRSHADEAEDDEGRAVGEASERGRGQPIAPITNPPAMTGTRPSDP